MNCFECGDEGHMARDCPNTTFAGPVSGSPWCGICDRATRLVGTPNGIKRCPACHPLRHEHLRQFRRCPHCRMIVRQWDNAPCGQHSAPDARDRKPPIEHIREITGRTT